MGLYKRAAAATKKAYKRAKKATKQRYGLNKASVGMNLGTMANDVMMLKKIINSEKKSYQAVYTNQNLGQVNANVTGALCYDITPYISQGLGGDARIGTSIKLCSGLYQFQFSQLADLTIRQNFIIEFWINKGTQLDIATAQSYIHTASTFSTVIDINSPRDQNRYSEFRLIRRVKRSIAPDQLTAQGTTSTFDVPISFNKGKGHHVRLVTNPTGVPQDCLNGQLFMTVRADVGNANAITASTKPVPLTAVNTASVMRFGYRVWYYDN